jgi:flagellar motor switch protein FliN/FliY
MSVLDSVDNAKLILDHWAESLADVVASMTDQRPEVRWSSASGPVEAAGGALWWEQPFHPDPGLVVWVAAPPEVWDHTGSVTLKAAGLETFAAAEVRNTWLEILGQSLSVMARSIGAVFGHEVTCDPGSEREADRDIGAWASVAVRFPDADLPPMSIAIGSRLLSLLVAPPSDAAGERRETLDSGVEPSSAPPDPPADLSHSRTMDLLLDVDLPVSISFGKTQLALKDVLKLTTGSIVELNRGVNDQVEVLVNQCLIARGEVVVVEGNYGVRIQQIASRQDRLRSMR